MAFKGRRITRRELLKAGLMGGTAALALPAEGFARVARVEPLTPPPPFGAQLTVPPVLRPVGRVGSTRQYRVVMKQAEAEIIPGLSTPIWGYNGTFPGPTIKARKGRGAAVRFLNDLPEDMVVHAHGAYVDGDGDGHPADMIQPGGRKQYVYGNKQNARTMWYHDHAMHLTAPHIYKGLSGFFIVTDDFERDLPLPKGPYDVPLMIQDRAFNSDGSFDYPNGAFGNVILVNGKPQPRFEVAARKYRLRILNASNVRSYDLALDSGEPLTVIATEGGLLAAPLETETLTVVPAERYEVVVDFSAYPVGSQVVLKNLRGAGSTGEVMRFDVVRAESDSSEVPSVLRPPRLQRDQTHLAADPDSVTRTRRFVFGQTDGHWTINGLMWDEDRIDAAPREGDTEIWEFVSTGGEHPTHLHLLNFKVLDRNGAEPRPYETSWKETVSVGTNETVRVLMKWPEVPIGPKRSEFARRYPFHCHNLQHEDHAMMLQFKVRRRR